MKKEENIGAATFDEIGRVSQVIWETLNKGDMLLIQLKAEVNCKEPIFDWAIGWLAHEDKIQITPEEGSFRLHAKDPHIRAALI